MLRDIDYAAVAVKKAIVEKFGRDGSLENLRADAGEKTIEIEHDGRLVDGTRDDLLAAVRSADSFEAFWTAVSRV